MSIITKEQAKDLRNAFQFWQQDYDPVEDKEQYDMFWLGMVVMDALLASLEAEHVHQLLTGDAWVDLSKGAMGSQKRVGAIVRTVYSAPPAPVSVPDERAAFNAWNNDTDCPLAGRDAKTAAWLAWNRRAAMLQGVGGNPPVIPDGGDTTPPYQGWVVTHGGKDYFHRKQSDAVTRLNAAIESGGGASLIAVIAEPVTTAYKLPFDQWLSQQTGTIDVECGCVMTEVFFHWLRVAYEAGNSPHCREILNLSTKNFRENAETSTKCSCRTCRPVTFADSHFVVCPECGNKRCPHANDHRNACTGSNEPGQECSAYPAAPQQEVKP